jgi:hypothetical protein
MITQKDAICVGIAERSVSEFHSYIHTSIYVHICVTVFMFHIHTYLQV